MMGKLVRRDQEIILDDEGRWQTDDEMTRRYLEQRVPYEAYSSPSEGVVGLMALEAAVDLLPPGWRVEGVDRAETGKTGEVEF